MPTIKNEAIVHYILPSGEVFRTARVPAGSIVNTHENYIEIIWKGHSAEILYEYTWSGSYLFDQSWPPPRDKKPERPTKLNITLLPPGCKEAGEPFKVADEVSL